MCFVMDNIPAFISWFGFTLVAYSDAGRSIECKTARRPHLKACTVQGQRVHQKPAITNKQQTDDGYSIVISGTLRAGVPR